MTPPRWRGSRRRRASSPSSTAWALPIPRRRANGRGRAQAGSPRRSGGAGGSHIAPSRLQGDAGSIYYQERVAWTRGLGAVRRQWTPRARAWLQRAMDGADPAQPLALWRRGAPGRSRPSVARRMASAVMAIARCLPDQGPCLGRLSGGWRRGAAARDQSAPRRHARHFRLRRQTPLLRLHLEAVREGRLPPQRAEIR